MLRLPLGDIDRNPIPEGQRQDETQPGCVTDVEDSWEDEDTCSDTVEGVRQQVVDQLPLLERRPAAGDLIQGGVGLMHPLHQPLQLAVTSQAVPSQVATHTFPHTKKNGGTKSQPSHP